jgi:hypothetical protein
LFPNGLIYSAPTINKLGKIVDSLNLKYKKCESKYNFSSISQTVGCIVLLEKRRVKQESDWKKYYGSCPELKEDIKKYNKENFNREILSLHTAKGDCNYEETKQLFLNNVLKESLDDGTPAYYNSNILGRYMRKDYGNFGTNASRDT